MKKIVILGSTGEIGKHALAVAAKFPEKLQVIGLACGQDKEALKQQIAQWQPQMAVVASENPEGLIELATLPEADLVVVAVVGVAGIAPTLAAIRAGKNVALATKEVLVIAGEIVLQEAKKSGSQIIPLDSEHSAMFQALQSGKISEIERVYLTMGQGRIAQMTKEQMAKLSPEEVLQVNRWKMGQKITVDAATCVNKIFEAIEAAKLFNLKAEQIQIVVHPEYICHSLVEFQDGSIIGEFGTSNMERYLQYGLLYPERLPSKKENKMSLLNQRLTFLSPDDEKFSLLKLVSKLVEAEGNLPALFHGADRAMVEAFLERKIGFVQLFELLTAVIMENSQLELATKFDLKLALTTEELGYQLAKEKINNYVSK